MSEVAWENLFFKFLDILDVETEAVLRPRDQVVMLLFLNRNFQTYLENFEGFRDERRNAGAFLHSGTCWLSPAVQQRLLAVVWEATGQHFQIK